MAYPDMRGSGDTIRDFEDFIALNLFFRRYRKILLFLMLDAMVEEMLYF